MPHPATEAGPSPFGKHVSRGWAIDSRNGSLPSVGEKTYGDLKV